jgi:hypothetical protein
MPVDDKLINEVRAADGEYRAARRALTRATRKRAAAVAKVHGAGMSLRDLGTLLGINHTRVSQLVDEAAMPKRLVKARALAVPRILVRASGSDVWHWCRNCSNYPSRPVDQRVLLRGKRPRGGELCNQCKANEAAETCV